MWAWGITAKAWHATALTHGPEDAGTGVLVGRQRGRVRHAAQQERGAEDAQVPAGARHKDPFFLKGREK